MSLILKYDLGNPHRLPVGYTPLAYIESTGTLYIDTTCLGNSNTSIILDYIYTELVSSAGIIGTGRGSTTEPMNGFRFYYNGANKYYVSCNSKLNASTLPSSPLYYAGERYHTLMNGSSGVITTNGISVTVNSYGAGSDNTYSLMLFKAYSACCKAKLYKCTIILNGLTIRDFIPAKNSSGVIGLFDCVSQTFFTNQGTGSFIAGPEVVILPYEYLLVEYLEGTGTLWIDTNYLCNADNLLNLKYKLDAMATDTAVGNNWWACGIGGASGIGFHVGIGAGSSAKPFTFARGISDVNTGVNGSLNTRYKWELDMVNLTYKVWSESGASLVDTTFTRLTPTQSQNLALFRWRSYSNSGYIFGMKIYHMELYNTSSLVRNMIPCYRRSDLKPGMYDIVNNVFYTNSGSGEFILGPVVEESSRQLEYNNAGSNYIGIPKNIHHSTSNPSSTLINLGSGDFNTNSWIKLPQLQNLTHGSISFWLKVNTLKNIVIVGNEDEYYYLGATRNNGTSAWYHNKCGTITTYVDGIVKTTPTADTNWHHIVFTGVNLSTWTTAYLNKYISVNSGWNVDGCYYDFRIYDNVLTADEVLKIYKGGL